MILTALGEVHNSSLCNFFLDPSSSVLGPNILLNAFVLKEPQSLFYKMRVQASHP